MVKICFWCWKRRVSYRDTITKKYWHRACWKEKEDVGRDMFGSSWNDFYDCCKKVNKP